MSRPTVYTSTFIFTAKPYDDDFHRLNDEIAERARALPGFLGEESWENPETGLHERWIGPYRVVIGQVLSEYGQPGVGLEHVPAEAVNADR